MAMFTRANSTEGSVQVAGFITITGVGGTRGTGLTGSMMVMASRRGPKGAGIEDSTGRV